MKMKIKRQFDISVEIEIEKSCSLSDLILKLFESELIGFSLVTVGA